MTRDDLVKKMNQPWTIYSNRIPWGLLTDDERAALQAHPGPWNIAEYDDVWVTTVTPGWAGSFVYRAVAPAPLRVKDWGLLPEWVRHVSRDSGGIVYAWEKYPTKERDLFWIDRSCRRTANLSHALSPAGLALIVDPGTCDWREAVDTRPEAAQ